MINIKRAETDNEILEYDPWEISMESDRLSQEISIEEGKPPIIIRNTEIDELGESTDFQQRKDLVNALIFYDIQKRKG